MVSDNLAYASSGDYERRQHPVYAFKPGANGAIRGGESHLEKSSSEFIQWHFEGGGAEITSPLVYDGYFYTLHDRGYIGCNDATTGEIVYERQRLRGKFMASPWAYNDRIFV